MKSPQIILLLLAIAIGSNIQAQHITSSEAMMRAGSYLQKGEQKAPSRDAVDASDAPLTIEHIASEGDEIYYYVINRGQNDGFVVVGGDQRVAPILAHSTTGHLDMNHLPAALSWLLDCYREQCKSQIKQAAATADDDDTPYRPWNQSWAEIEPMMKTDWDQDWPYNLGITGGTNPYLAGCVPIAFAQLLKYHSYPEQGVDHQFDAVELGTYNGVTYTSLPINTNMHIDWDLMLDRYSSYKESKTYDNPVIKAMADLVYLTGRCCKVKYGIYSSGAYVSDGAYALMDYLGYAPTVTCNTRSGFSIQQWETMIYQELAEGRPVIYFGTKQYDGIKVGHCFLICGYKEGQFYLNIGGAYIYALLPEKNGTNDEFTWNNDQQCYTQITPDHTYRPRVTPGIFRAENSVIGGKPSIMLCSRGSSPDPSYCIVNSVSQATLVSCTTQRSYTLPIEYTSNKPSSGSSSGWLLPDNLPLDEDYEVKLRFRSEFGEWQEVPSEEPVIFHASPNIIVSDEAVGDTECSTWGSLTRGKMATLQIGNSACGSFGGSCIGVRIHNLTTPMADQISLTQNVYSLSQTWLYYRVPSELNAGDEVELQLMYYSAEGWKELPANSVVKTINETNMKVELIGDIQVPNDGFATRKNLSLVFRLRNVSAEEQEVTLYGRIGGYASFSRKVTLKGYEEGTYVLTPANATSNSVTADKKLEGQYITAYYSNQGESVIYRNELMPNCKLVMEGDVNQNGRIDEEDFNAILNHILDPINHQLAPRNRASADINGNGEITVADLAALLEMF